MDLPLIYETMVTVMAVTLTMSWDMVNKSQALGMDNPAGTKPLLPLIFSDIRFKIISHRPTQTIKTDE